MSTTKTRNDGIYFTGNAYCYRCGHHVLACTYHWCPQPNNLSASYCQHCQSPFNQLRGHSCFQPHANPPTAWRQNLNGTITFCPLADCPAPTIWGTKPIPVPVSTKDRLQRQIKHLRLAMTHCKMQEDIDGDLYILVNDASLKSIVAILGDLALDL